MRPVLRILRFGLMRLFRGALHHPRLVLIIALLLALSGATQVKNLRTLLDFNDFIDSSSHAVRNFEELQRLFKPGHSLLVVLSRRDDRPLTAEEVCSIDSWIRGEQRTNPEVASVTSPFELRRPVYENRTLWYMPWLGLACGPRTTTQALAGTPWQHVFTSHKGSDLLVEFHLRDVPGVSRFGSFDPRVVGQIERSLERAFEKSSLRWTLTGRAGFQWYQWQALQRDHLLNLGLLALIVVCFRIFFGAWRGGFLLVGTLVCMGAVLFGAMAVIGAPIDLISNSLFAIVTIAVLEDFLFLSYRQLVAPHEHWTATFSRFLVPGFLTSLTTVIGFGSLCFGSLPIIQRLGFWAATGTMLEWAATFLLLPAFLKVFPSQSTWVNPQKAIGLAWVKRLTARSIPRWATIACLGLVPLGVFGAFHLSVSDDAKIIFPKGHPFRESVEYLSRSRGWEADASLVFSSATTREKAEPLLARIRSFPEVAFIHSPWEVMDSLVAGLPPTVANLVRNEVSQAPFHEKYFAESGEAHASVYMKSGGLDGYAKLREAVASACPKGECFLAGPMTTYEELTSEVVPTLLQSCAVSLSLVSGFLALLCLGLRQGRQAIPVIMSSLWGSFAMMAVLWLCRYQVNYLTCIFASVLVGIAGDNAINFLVASGRRTLGAGVGALGGASLHITLTTMVAITVLFGAAFEPPKTLALLFLSGLALNLFGDVWLLKGLTRKE